MTAGNNPLQMIRADINIREFHRWMGTRRLQDPDHGMHCLLTESFGPDLAPKPFRMILPRSASKGSLYGYGMADANALREAAAAYACPLQTSIIPASNLDSKPMPSEWTNGKRLGFEIRVRPIIRSSRNAQRRPGKEWDAFQLAASQYPKNEKNEMPHTREQIYRDWLSRQLAGRGGATLESASLHSFQRTRAVRQQRARYSEGPDALMRGVLAITDGAAFSQLLARGVGRHRSYGYGMLLLRPASQPR